MSTIREKEPLECGRMHIWALKTQKLPGPLSGPWTQAADSLLHLHDSALLHWQFWASEAGPSLDQILDPHLKTTSQLIWQLYKKFVLITLCFHNRIVMSEVCMTTFKIVLWNTDITTMCSLTKFEPSLGLTQLKCGQHFLWSSGPWKSLEK